MNHAPQTTNPQEIAAARLALLAAFRATFTTPEGQRVLQHLRNSAGINRPIFLPPPGGGPLDTHAAAFRDGRHSILHEINELLAVPEDQEQPKPPQVLGKPTRKRTPKA